MNEIILKDEFRVSDSNKIKGFVVLERTDGTVIFKKENMIVENGRKYLRDLVYGTLFTGSAETRKFANIKFGTNNIVTTPVMTDIASSSIQTYTINTTDLVWSEWINTKYTFGTAVPPNTFGVNDDLFVYNNNNGVYSLYKKVSGTWNIFSGITFTASQTLILDSAGSSGNYFFHIATSKLYIKENKLVKLSDNIGIGLKLNIRLTGSNGLDNAKELGLFLTDGTNQSLFSRLVFEPVSLAAGYDYKLTYYIYF
jgi:hypothetical protein